MRHSRRASRVAIAAVATSTLALASAFSFAPSAPADEREVPEDERLAVVGATVLPLGGSGAVLVADLDGLVLAQSLAAALGDNVGALGISALLAPESTGGTERRAVLETVAAAVEAADVVVVVDRDRDRDPDEPFLEDAGSVAGSPQLADGVSPLPAGGPHRADRGVQLPDDDAPGPDDDVVPGPDDDVSPRGDVCRELATTWLLALGTPGVVATENGLAADGGDTDPIAEDDADDAEASTKGDDDAKGDAGSDDAEADGGPDIVYVLDPRVDDAALADVLTGRTLATGAVPEVRDPERDVDETNGNEGEDNEGDGNEGDGSEGDGNERGGDVPSDCPELPEIAPGPEPDLPEPPSDSQPVPDVSPEPAPDQDADPDEPVSPSPDPDQPDGEEPGIDAPAPDGPDAEDPHADDPDADQPDGDEPGAPAPEAPETPDVPGPPAPGPPPDIRIPDLVEGPKAPHHAPWRLPTRKPAGNPLAVSVLPGGLNLSDVTIDGDLITLSGELPGITVIDHRKGAAQGWTLSAQVSDLQGPAVLPASQLGWTPRVHDERAVPGPAIAPALSGGAGLAGAAVLGSAPRGTAGSPVELDAAVVLETTRDAAPGAYAGVITLTLFPSE